MEAVTSLGFTVTMVKTIVFVSIIIIIIVVFFLPKPSLADKHETCTGMDP